MVSWLKLIFYGWDYNKYWSIRCKFYNPRTSKLRKKFYYWLILWINRRNAADINLGVTETDNFKGIPKCGHGIRGVVIAGGAIIGENCYISHQVTIGRSLGEAPIIGDNVYIGPGAKIFGGIKVGNNVRIGANCIVFEDVPDNATVVLQKPRVIIKPAGYEYYAFKKGV